MKFKTYSLLMGGLCLLFSWQSAQTQTLFGDPAEVFVELPNTFFGSTFQARYGDLNNDGLLDIMAFKGGNALSDVEMYLNNGTDEPFADDPVLEVNFQAWAFFFLDLADMTGDGRLDVLVDNGYRIQMDDYNFDAFQRYAEEESFRSLQKGDVNGDGLTDAIVYNENNLSCVLNNGDGTTSFVQLSDSYLPVSSFLQGVVAPAIADFTGDDLPDVLAYPGTAEQSLVLYVQQAEGTFVAQAFPYSQSDLNPGETVPISSNKLDGVDYDNDGDLDILFENDEGIYWMTNDGTGTFTALETLLTKESSMAQYYHDVNMDEVIDIMRVNFDNGDIDLLLRAADGTTTETLNFTGGSYFALRPPVLADFDGDGDLDLLERQVDGGDTPLYVRLNNTVGGPTTATAVWQPVAHELFPNPTQDVFQLTIADTEWSGGQLLMYNAQAQLVSEQPVHTTTLTTDVRRFAKGWYSYRLVDEAGRIRGVGKLVVQ